MAIGITETAANRVRHLIAQQPGDERRVLRLGVAGGGCSGMTYKIDFDREANIAPKDKVFEDQGIKVVVDHKSMLFLEGTVLDYAETMMQSGFVFKNPNAKQTCGCGESFGV